MENQTGFDLNNAIQNWQKELAQQSGLTAEVRRELETHLRDSVTELQRRGLDAEESFWLARRRVGQPRQLGEEFQKGDPIAVWRERLFWIMLGIFVVQLWFDFAPFLWELATRPFVSYLRSTHGQVFPDWVLFYVQLPSAADFMAVLRSPLSRSLFSLLPIVFVAVLFARGRMPRADSAVQFFFRSRRRLVSVCAALFSIYGAWMLIALVDYAAKQPMQGNPSLSFVVQGSLARLLSLMAMVGMIAWLLPGKKAEA